MYGYLYSFESKKGVHYIGAKATETKPHVPKHVRPFSPVLKHLGVFRIPSGLSPFYLKIFLKSEIQKYISEHNIVLYPSPPSKEKKRGFPKKILKPIQEDREDQENQENQEEREEEESEENREPEEGEERELFIPQIQEPIEASYYSESEYSESEYSESDAER